MRKYPSLLLILLTFTSCSQPSGKTKSNFKILIGKAAFVAPMNGGVFLETEEITTLKKSIVKLDAENSALIPQGSYNLLFISFTGPAEKTGTTYCGSVNNAALLTATATMNVALSQARCSEPRFLAFINKLTSNSNWDSATFDNSKWGP